MLVIGQVALAVTVVAGASLLARSLQQLQTADMGWRTEDLVLAELALPSPPYEDQARRRQFFDTLLTRLRVTPGLEAVVPINALPFAGAAGWDVPQFTGEGQTEDEVLANPPLNFEVVTPGYFSTLGVAVVRGRDFTPGDREGVLRVAMVSEAVAARLSPDGQAIGRRVKMDGAQSRAPWLTVVGVAATTRYRELAVPRPTLYLPADQFMFTFGRLAIRTPAEPFMVARAIRDAVAAADAGVHVEQVAPYAHYLRAPLAWPRFHAPAGSLCTDGDDVVGGRRLRCSLRVGTPAPAGSTQSPCCVPSRGLCPSPFETSRLPVPGLRP